MQVGDTLAVIHANHEVRIEKAMKDILRNYEIKEEKGQDIPLVYEVIR